MSSVKRFVLNVFTNGELDDVVVGLEEINEYVTSTMQYPVVEDKQDELVDLYENESELEEFIDE